MSKTVLMTGATGMVGGQVLGLLLEHPDVGKVISIGRRTSGVTHAKLREIVHADFLDFSPLEADLTGIDVCFHCLGVYQGQVSRDAFFEVTCGCQKALTDTLAKASPQATFVLFGAQGADPTEKSPALFARAKGRAEALLHAAGFPRTYVFRPGYIQPTGARRPTGLAYTLALPLATALFKVFPRIGVSDRQLAQAMVTTGLEATAPSGIFGNPEIREIAARPSP